MNRSGFLRPKSGSLLPQRLTLVLGLATLIAAFGSSFQYGYNVAAINSPAQVGRWGA